MAQQSSGFSGWVKLGKASTRRAAVASSKGANGMPASSPWSASNPHSPPDSDTAAMRRPRGQRRRPRTSSVSSNSWKSFTSIAPVVAEQRREGACRADYRARVRERGARSGLRAPDLEADDRLAGLGRCRQGGDERAGPPDRLDEQADRARALVLGQEPHEIGQIARELAPRRDDRAKADARTAGQERLADRARVGDAGHVPGHERVGSRNGAEPERDAARSRDAHAVRPHHRHVALCGARPDARGDRAALGAGLGAQPGYHDCAHTGRDHVLEGGFRACVSHKQVGALRALGQRRDGVEALASKHVGPRRIHEPGRSAARQHLPESGRALGGAVAGTDHRDRAREEQGADPAAQVGRSHGISAPSQVSASAGSRPP